MDKISKILRKIFTLPIIFYKRFISPLLPKSCIYTPTCSEYMKDAILKHGILKGFILGFLRILRCNSFFKGGEDHVEEKTTIKDALKNFKNFKW